MIDKILEKFFGYIDTMCEGIASLAIAKPKPKRKKRKCKDCNCNCDCKDDLHLYNDNQELCACESCKC